MKNITLQAFTGLCLAFAIAAPANSAVVGWGAETSNVIFGLCCSSNGSIERNGDGGEFQSSAASDLTNSFGTSEAESTLNGGGISTPILKGYSSAGQASGAFSSAVGAQGYTYTGAAQTITLDLNLDVILDEQAAGSRADATARVAVIFASDLGFWTDFGTLVFEVAPPGSVADQTSMFANIDPGLRGLVSVNDSLVFDVVPGDEFLVWAGLDTGARFGGEADARNTFSMNFFDALGNLITDPAVLAAENMAVIGAVPLPAGIWLFVSAIALVGGFARRKAAV